MTREIRMADTGDGSVAPKDTLDLFLIAMFVLGTVFVFGGVIRNDLITLDYHYYVGNPRVQEGLTWDGLEWALTHEVASNWHPLTMLAQMAISGLFGTSAAAHHAVNLALHVGSVLLVVYLLTRMTGRAWRAAAVAALFGLHPLRVESVAWTAELKDVLSAFLALLTILAYVRFTERRTATRYAVTVVLFILGLLSKAILVTLPCALLLLDYWPLQRFPLTRDGLRSRVFRIAILEKVPLLALSGAMIAITFVTFGDSTLRSLDETPRVYFVAMALVGYAKYLWLTLIPLSLAPHYPYPGPEIPYLAAGLSAALLVVITAVAFVLRRRCPYLLTGWLWFVGVLLPVSGIFPVGSHYIADRYTYLPHIGLFAAIVWLVGDWAARSKAWRRAVMGLTVAVVVVMAGLSYRQVGLWRTNLSLFQHAVEVSPESGLMHASLAVAYRQVNDLEAMERHLREAMALSPGDVGTKRRLVALLLVTGRPGEAEPFARALVEDAPGVPEHYVFLAEALWQQGSYNEARVWARKALEIAPGYGAAQEILGRTPPGEE